MSEIGFDSLPPEVIYLIFDYLPPSSLHYVIRRVCKRFAQLLSRDAYFMVRFNRKLSEDNLEFLFSKHYGLSEDGSNSFDCNVSWTDLAVRFDLRDKVWVQRKKDIEHLVFGMPHHSTTVDAICLLKDARICVSGGRDKLLCLWDVNDTDPEDTSLKAPLAHIIDAHNGWIWDITSHDDDNFYSCAWDFRIKRWSVDPLTCIATYQTERPTQCISTTRTMVVAGLHNGKINIFDPRIGYSNNHLAHKIHKGAITGLKLWNEQVICIGEDRKLSAFDIRNKETLFYQNVNCCYRTCPRSINVYRDICYVGDSEGYVSLFSIKDNFKPIICSKVGLKKSINGIIPTLEGIVIGTADAGIGFITPTFPVQFLYTLDASMGEITSIDFKNNVVAAGCADRRRCIHILKGWRGCMPCCTDVC